MSITSTSDGRAFLTNSSACCGFSDLKLRVISWLRQRRYQKDLPLFLEMLNPRKEDVILDVGAGTGVIAKEVCVFCDDVFALEPATKKVDYIKRRFPEVKAFQGTAEHIQFPESYFTKVYAISAFHHFVNQDLAVEEFHRILRRGGMVLINEWSPESCTAKMEKREGHPKFKTPEESQEILELAGFEAKRLEKRERGYFLLCIKP